MTQEVQLAGAAFRVHPGEVLPELVGPDGGRVRLVPVADPRERRFGFLKAIDEAGQVPDTLFGARFLVRDGVVEVA